MMSPKRRRSFKNEFADVAKGFDEQEHLGPGSTVSAGIGGDPALTRNRRGDLRT